MISRPFAFEPSWCEFVCPFCKSQLKRLSDERVCHACNARFPIVDGAVDFRRRYPDGVQPPPGWAEWVHGQDDYEGWAVSKAKFDPSVIDEQRGMEPMYRRMLPMRGRVLDVAGGAGLVRDLLGDDDRFISVDPWLGAPGWLAAGQREPHPRVSLPVPFVGAHAEWLPFAASSFDWVHMRSAIDHFLDPFQAVREAWRVLVPGGGLAVGVAASGGPGVGVMGDGARGIAARVAHKLRHEGALAVGQRILERLRRPMEGDEHLWHPSLDNLKVLISAVGFTIEEWTWLEPPGDFVVFIRARKPLQ